MGFENRRFTFDESVLKEMSVLYESGMSFAKIAKLYNLHPQSIGQAFKRNKIPRRSRSAAAQIRTFQETFCISCGDAFQKTNSNHKLCLGCIPNVKWRMRYQTYGITKKDYDKIVEKQGGLCPLCLKPLVEADAVVDHCHTTGVVRGILCGIDNRALGILENPEFIARAFSYLKMDRT